MSLKARIQEDVKAAMRAQDKRRLGALRLVSAAIKQREVDERIELDDSQVVAVLRKMLKQRQDSLTQFRAGGRDDLADQEAFEIALIEGFLPQALGVEEVIYFPDRDIAGEEAMHTVCKLIESWLPVTVADVSSLPLDEVATAKKGKPVFPDLGDLCAEDIRLCKTNRKRYSAGLSIL